MIVLIPQYCNLYKDCKQLCYKYSAASQFIKDTTYRNFRKFVARGSTTADIDYAGKMLNKRIQLAANVLKQINSKLGGDLFYLKFNKDVTARKVMLLGLDVCHSGEYSNVGFCASINK